jgi:RimJ/RimL family protein N-acetyltransferase
MINLKLPRVSFRLAGEKDCKRIWKWRNDRTTREASFNSNPILYTEHKRWFSRRLKDPKCCIFIVSTSYGKEVGYVRFEISDEEAEISVGIDKDERGRGYGAAAIQNASDHLLKIKPIHRIIARIKRDSPASIGAFTRAGFELRRYTSVANADACEMEYAPKQVEPSRDDAT